MKKIFILLAIAAAINTTSGQGLGIGVSNLHNSSIVELSSTSRGLLPPRLSTAQRLSIVNPATGLLAFDNDLNIPMQFNGNLWTPVGGSIGLVSLPFASNTALASMSPLSITNSFTGNAIQGTAAASFTSAIKGTADGQLGSYGVFGQATHASGIGVAGFSTDASAVYGFSSNGGTALRGTASPGGYALETNGYIRLTGGNTNPVEGAVLTSTDAAGNAVWRKPMSELAFGLAGAAVQFATISHNSWQKVHFAQEQYDYGNDCEPTTNTSPTPGMSSFVVPTTGIYEFDMAVGLSAGGAGQEIGKLELQLMVNRAGNVFAAFTLEGNTMQPGNEKEQRAHGGTQCRLQAGDIVYVNARQTNNFSGAVNLVSSAAYTFFSGHLIYAY